MFMGSIFGGDEAYVGGGILDRRLGSSEEDAGLEGEDEGEVAADFWDWMLMRAGGGDVEPPFPKAPNKLDIMPPMPLNIPPPPPPPPPDPPPSPPLLPPFTPKLYITKLPAMSRPRDMNALGGPFLQNFRDTCSSVWSWLPVSNSPHRCSHHPRNGIFGMNNMTSFSTTNAPNLMKLLTVATR